MKILFLGGDKRAITAFAELKKSGYNIDSLGLFEDDMGEIEEGDFVLLPVPTSKDGISVNCPLTKRYFWLEDLDNTDKNCTFITSGYEFKKHKFIDLLKLDDFAILNAIPTAEGAISAAIENTEFTLWKSKVLVIGNGRVGKILSERLKNLYCDVTVSARKPTDFALIDALGMKFTLTNTISKIIETQDIIFNTVDITFDNETAKKCSDKLVIDLSTLGCFNKKQLTDYQIKYMKLPGIPGKVAPITAGKIIANTLIRIIES